MGTLWRDRIPIASQNNAICVRLWEHSRVRQCPEESLIRNSAKEQMKEVQEKWPPITHNGVAQYPNLRFTPLSMCHDRTPSAKAEELPRKKLVHRKKLDKMKFWMPKCWGAASLNCFWSSLLHTHTRTHTRLEREEIELGVKKGKDLF